MYIIDFNSNRYLLLCFKAVKYLHVIYLCSDLIFFCYFNSHNTLNRAWKGFKTLAVSSMEFKYMYLNIQ